LKKRSKKLLQMASGIGHNAETRMLPDRGKSFLVLFFKKEHPSLRLQNSDRGQPRRAINLAISQPRAIHLPATGTPLQLHHVLENLPQAGSTDRFAARQAPAIRVDG
jgi:hypothetical protein